MSVHIDQASSELLLEPETPAAQPQSAQGAGPAWEELERWRVARERARQDAERTRAEGYGD